METKSRIWSVAAGVVAITVLFTGGVAFLFWRRLPSEVQVFLLIFVKEHFIYLFSFTCLLLIGLGLLLDGVIHIYVLPIKKMIEETTLISTVNPAHRITPDGSPDVKLLAEVINQWAELYHGLQKNIRREIRKSQAEVERERNILAALMDDFHEGVLVCNTEGQILLYNRRATRFFSQSLSENSNSGDLDSAQPIAAPVKSLPEAHDHVLGLGRFIFRIIDKNLIVHAMEEMTDKLDRKAPDPVSYFVAVTQEETLLRVEMTPVLSRERQLTGMILVLDDISEKLERDQRVTLLVQSLINGLRASLGSIRSAIETVMAYPKMAPAQRDRFQKIIHEESMTLGQLVEQVGDEYPQESVTQWPKVSMRAEDLINTVKRRASAQLDVVIHLDETAEDESHWIKVDSYSIILAILFLLNRLRQSTDGPALAVRIGRQDRFTAVDLIWTGDPVRIATLRRWEGEPLQLGSEGLALTLGEVIGYHEADIWSSTSRRRPGSAYLRLLLPSSDAAADAGVVRNVTVLAEEHRPMFYDFDLFNQAGLTAELGERLLTELAYTVFDMETTGLDPRGGDEIISLGAVRIVNGRLLPGEQFDRLIDPRRPLSRESIRIHGIRPEMLAGQPTIAQVLPRFHRFCEETVLVAHNAAFDMLMLKLKEAVCGATFTHPVLDTLLLSDGLHPNHRTHDLEEIARRIGVSVIDRHTALGDALTTAEIWLKMMPLLASKGISTLNDAIDFSKRSRFVRLKY